MATCPCGQPIATGDLFCIGCGKPVAVMEAAALACPRCGRLAPAQAAFCGDCGAALIVATAAVPPAPGTAAQGFQWKWALLTIPIVVGVTLAVMVLAGVCTVAAGVDMESETTQMNVGVAVLIIGMMLGGMLAGWLSPGRTVVEPGVGIAVTLLVFNALMGDAGGWLLPFLIGAAGAWIGEHLPKRSPPTVQ